MQHKFSIQQIITFLTKHYDDDHMIKHYLVHTAHEALRQFSVSMSFADSCSLLVSRFSRPTDWSKVFVDCIHVVFCRPLGLVTDFNAICNACMAGVTSGSLKMCPVNLSLF